LNKKLQFFCHGATEKWGLQGWLALSPNSQNMSQPLKEALKVSINSLQAFAMTLANWRLPPGNSRFALFFRGKAATVLVCNWNTSDENLMDGIE
jgi:hypothetical protein